MGRGRSHLFAVLAAIAVALALPALASAHQSASLSAGELTITGDFQGKPNDLITLSYDSGANEIVIGNDIFDGHPSECSPDSANPLRIFHCPAALITSVEIEAGAGNNQIDASLPAGVPVLASATAGNNNFTGGPEADNVTTGSGSDKVDLGDGDDFASLGGGSDKAFGGSGGDSLKGGGGSDKLLGQGGPDSLFGGGGSDKLFGQGGADSLFGGGGADKLMGGGGTDDCVGAPGHGKQLSC
jgi:Ca2+-binding RTX toxin-like protein